MKKFLKSFAAFSVVFLTVVSILLIISAVFMIMKPDLILTVIYCSALAMCGIISLVILTFLTINLFSFKKKRHGRE